MQKYRICAGIVAAAAVVSMCACSSGMKSSKAELQTVMTVDGIEVPYEMYRYAVMMHLRDRSEFVLAERQSEAETTDTVSETAESGTTASDKEPREIISDAIEGLSDSEKEAIAAEVRGYSLETVAKIYSIWSVAKECGIDPDSDNIEKMTDMKLEELRATYDSDKDYLSTLKLYFMNNNVYRTLVKYEIIYDEVYEAYLKNGTIAKTEDFAVSYMRADTGARAKQILISFERHNDAEALALAEKVSADVLSHVSSDGTIDEETFDSLCDKYGEDLYTFKNRDGYYLPLGYYDEAFEEAAFALDIGHVSDIVRTSSGYSIVMRCEKDDSYITENASKLVDTCVTGAFNVILRDAAESAEIVTNDAFDKIDIFNIK